MVPGERVPDKSLELQRNNSYGLRSIHMYKVQCTKEHRLHLHRHFHSHLHLLLLLRHFHHHRLVVLGDAAYEDVGPSGDDACAGEPSSEAVEVVADVAAAVVVAAEVVNLPELLALQQQLYFLDPHSPLR